MQKMGGWHQNRNRHPGVRLDHSGSFRNAHRGRGGYGTGIHTAEGAIPKWLRLSYELGVLCDSVRLHCPPSWRQSLASGGDSRPMNRWNLGCRALLELAALGVMGTWGYENGTGVGQYVLMAGVPVTAGALWGIFAVQGDPSRSGQTVVPTPGVIRWDSNWRCAGLGTAPIRQRDDLRLDPHGFANMQALRALCVRRWFSVRLSNRIRHRQVFCRSRNSPWGPRGYHLRRGCRPSVWQTVALRHRHSSNTKPLRHQQR